MANLASFTVSTAPAATDHVVGYASAAAGGERRWTHANLFKLDNTAASTGLILGTTTPGAITGASGSIVLTAAGTNQPITLTPSGTGSNISAGPLRITGTNVLQLGATANATINVSADTTAGVMTFTAPSLGRFSLAGGTATITDTTASTSTTTGALQVAGGVGVAGAVYAATFNGNTFTAGTGVLTLGAGKTLTASNTLTFTGTDASSVAFGAGGSVAYTANNLSVFAATTSAQLAGVISDETGSGALVFATSPTLTTPTLGVATATTINKVTITAPVTGSTLTVADGKTLTASNTLTLTGTDASSVAFGAGGTVAYVANNLSVFAATTSAQLAGVVSDETGSGALVFATSPALVTPAIGAATGASLTVTGAVVSTGATSGMGYATGAGGAVTQITSRTTGVTLNTVCGEITLVSAAGTASWQTFTVTNSAVAATDRVILNQKSGTDLHLLHVTALGAGSFNISFATTGGTTTETPVIGFTVIKSVNA